MHLIDWILLFLIALLVLFALKQIRKGRGCCGGGSGCCGNCASCSGHCAGCGKCGKAEKMEKKKER